MACPVELQDFIVRDHWRLLSIRGSIRGHLADCLWLSKETLSAQRNFGASVHGCYCWMERFGSGGLGCTPHTTTHQYFSP